jgi:hypothetical protein
MNNMRVGIVTVYKSDNCGSFLQAWALQYILQKRGYEVCFIPYKKAVDNTWDISFQVIKCCIKLRFATAKYLIHRAMAFHSARCKLNVKNVEQEIDVYIYGSDTIWNFDDKYFYSQSGFFTGQSVKEPKIAYAASAGSTELNKFTSIDGICTNLNEFKEIAVRDDQTLSLVRALMPDKNICKVLDPTMLLKRDDYSEIEAQGDNEDYVLIYYFGKMPNDLYHQVLSFAKKQELSLLHIGFPDKRFRNNVVNDPFKFLNYFGKAKYVITNTFHGCVFSVLFNKQFVTDGYKKKKIYDLLNRFRLTDRCLKSNVWLEELINSKIDYKAVNLLIEQERKNSLEYLDAVLAKIEAETGARKEWGEAEH